MRHVLCLAWIYSCTLYRAVSPRAPWGLPGGAATPARARSSEHGATSKDRDAHFTGISNRAGIVTRAGLMTAAVDGGSDSDEGPHFRRVICWRTFVCASVMVERVQGRVESGMGDRGLRGDAIVTFESMWFGLTEEHVLLSLAGVSSENVLLRGFSVSARPRSRARPSDVASLRIMAGIDDEVDSKKRLTLAADIGPRADVHKMLLQAQVRLKHSHRHKYLRRFPPSY